MRKTKTRKPPIFYGWYMVAALVFIALVTNGARSSFGVFVIPMSESFDWNRSTISLAASLGFLVNGLSQPILGGFLDRFGGRVVILASLTILGLSTILLSLTTNIFFLMFMFGLVSSIALSGASLNNTGALLTRWFKRRRATVVGLNAAGLSLGGLIMVPFAIHLLQASDDNWRLVWIVLGAFILILAVPIGFIFIRNDPADMNLYPDGDPEPAETPRQASRQTSQLATPQLSGPLETAKWKESFRSWPIWQMTGSYFVCGATTAILAVHFVPYADTRGISTTTAGYIFGFMMALNVVGSIGAGILSDRFSRKNLLALVYFLRGSAYLLLLATEGIAGSLGLWIFAGVAGFSWIATAPLTTSLTADVYGLRALGTISGISFMVHAFGSALSVFLAGVLFDLTGSYTIPFAIAGALLFPAAISAFTIKEHKYSIRYQTQPATVPGSVAASGD